jgi:hypothetical protein
LDVAHREQALFVRMQLLTGDGHVRGSRRGLLHENARWTTRGITFDAGSAPPPVSSASESRTPSSKSGRSSTTRVSSCLPLKDFSRKIRVIAEMRGHGSTTIERGCVQPHEIAERDKHISVNSRAWIDLVRLPHTGGPRFQCDRSNSSICAVVRCSNSPNINSTSRKLANMTHIQSHPKASFGCASQNWIAAVANATRSTLVPTRTRDIFASLPSPSGVSERARFLPLSPLEGLPLGGISDSFGETRLKKRGL